MPTLNPHLEHPMGFLSAYEGVRRVIIPTPDPTREYWVDLKEHISTAAKDAADRLLTNTKKVIDPRTNDVAMEQDIVGWRRQLVFAHIVGWNLDDDNGTVWPINLQNLVRIPSDAFSMLFEIVNDLDGPASKEEQRQFPDPGVGGDPDRPQGRPAVAAGVPAADGTAPAAGDDAGGV